MPGNYLSSLPSTNKVVNSFSRYTVIDMSKFKMKKEKKPTNYPSCFTAYSLRHLGRSAAGWKIIVKFQFQTVETTPIASSAVSSLKPGRAGMRTQVMES